MRTPKNLRIWVDRNDARDEVSCERKVKTLVWRNEATCHVNPRREGQTRCHARLSQIVADILLDKRGRSYRCFILLHDFHWFKNDFPYFPFCPAIPIPMLLYWPGPGWSAFLAQEWMPQDFCTGILELTIVFFGSWNGSGLSSEQHWTWPRDSCLEYASWYAARLIRLILCSDSWNCLCISLHPWIRLK